MICDQWQKPILHVLVFSDFFFKAQKIIFTIVVIVSTDTGQTTDRQTLVKSVFSDSEGLKTSRFDKNCKNHFAHKINTFSYDEDIKIKQKNT